MDSSSQRRQPYRSKPDYWLQQLIYIAQDIKLFIVSSFGPSSFILLDQNKNKFKVQIGQQVSCSCLPNRFDHCVHTLFVMLKKFRVHPNNPMIWQSSYLDSELTDLI